MEVMEREGNVQKVDVEFGKTVFPTKLYGQYLYPAGEYEAIKITLGEGEGENWWCVLCFLDFNSGTAVKAQTTEEAAKQPIDEEVSKEKTVNQSIEQESEKPEAAQAEVINQSIDEEESAEETKVVYEDRDEEQVEVKFFLKEIFDSLF